MKSLRVLFLASEASPLVKVGGLGDVAGSLPGAIRALPGRPDLRVCLPLYPAVKNAGLDLLPIMSLNISHKDGPLRADVFQSQVNGIPFYLIDGQPVAAADQVYSGDNHQDGTKFVFFSLATLELARTLNWKPDIIHAHDWHTAPAVYHLNRIRNQDPFFSQSRSLLTVHNLPYLGHGAETALIDFGLLPPPPSALPDWARGFPLPQGLLAADKINTVSSGYAGEMLTAEFGAGLEVFLGTRESDLSGILNGLDIGDWDPAQDTALAENYTAATLDARVINKTRLQSELGLALDPDIPLLGMINRMEYQKGVDLVPEALRSLKDQRWQMVILGTGNPDLERAVRALDNDYPHVSAILTYDGDLARRIYGGSDLLLIPSRYEPCGLTQMIAMRYGSVPLARSTGGLKDTIIDFNAKGQDRSTGFLFDQAVPGELAKAIQRALAVYTDRAQWRGLQRRGMESDFSWERSAGEYLELYREIIENRRLKIED